MGVSFSCMQGVDLPIPGDEVRRARSAFEHEPAALDGGYGDSDGVVGEGVAAALGKTQPHRFTIPVEAKIELGEVAFGVAQRQTVILIEREG